MGGQEERFFRPLNLSTAKTRRLERLFSIGGQRKQVRIRDLGVRRKWAKGDLQEDVGEA
jgi:hypothetical protein